MKRLRASEDKKIPIHDRDRHVLNVLSKIARYNDNAPASLPALAYNIGYNLSYLEKVVALFRDHGIVKSIRGSRGGYVLARSPEQITVADVLRAAGAATPRGKANDWERFQEDVDALFRITEEIRFVILEHVSLADILEDRAASHPVLQDLLMEFRRS